MDSPSFILNGQTLTIIGSVIGVMGGVIGKLALIAFKAKDDEIKELRDERDYYRDKVFSSLAQGERLAEKFEKLPRFRVR